MKRWILAAVFCATCGPTLALSCLPHDVARTYLRASEAEEPYIVVHGRLLFDAERLPETDMQDQRKPPHTLIPARITGQALTRSGFDLDFDREITLDVQCFGPWCAGAVPGIDHLGFLERREDGYVLTLEPCGGMSHPEPTPEMLQRVLRCYQGGACAAKRP
ncbi:hypothetical protein [uncultured Roseovarius sp.]|uniref:hypothetical protein n=1 Tax=uncultured Roseovarius sp. TaxID=293344 RepID=UPI00261716A9|nr:hypothetical protein [uncultured Roseovarius sp.]